MFLFFKLAFRNLIRNRIRTALNLTMVVGAFCAIVVFRGFSHYMLSLIETSITEGQNGHVQIAKSAIWSEDYPKKMEDAYLENYQTIEKLLVQVPGTKYASARANAYVLLVNGDKSVGAYALGYDPKTEPNIEKILTFVDGSGFSNEARYEILVGTGLQKNLQLKVGQTLSVVSQTLANSMNSLDLEVRGAVKTGMADVDNSTVFIPLHVSQKLLGTHRVERIAVLMDKNGDLERNKTEYKKIIEKFKDVEIKDWKEISPFYTQLTNFYDMQNLVLQIILSILVFFGILNTLGMSIYERIGEIGTLMALGDRVETIMSQLVLEGFLLGLLGAALATPIAHLLCSGISFLEIPILLPGANLAVPVTIQPVLNDYLLSTIIVCLTCFAAIFWPAQRAVRLTIVDALKVNS